MGSVFGFPRLLAVLLVVAWCSPVRADPLSEAMRVVGAMPFRAGHVDLVAHMEDLGHLVLVNRKGERFTVSLSSRSGELDRALATLAPETKSGSRAVFHFTASMLFAFPDVAQALVPAGELERSDQQRLRVVIAGSSRRAWTGLQSRRASDGPIVEVAPNVTLQSPSEIEFNGAHSMLMRPLQRSSIRVIALKKGAPPVLSRMPRIDPSSNTALVDEVDPAAVDSVVRSAARETFVFTGDLSAYGVDAAKLLEAARERDVRLVHIETGSAFQPGGRNFLWLPVRTPALRVKAEQITLLELMVLYTEARAVSVRAAFKEQRLILDADVGATRGLSGNAGLRWLDNLSGVVGDVIGRAPPRRLTVTLPLPARQFELDRRFVPWLPSWLQYSYAAFVVIGIFGVPTAWRWFERVWPRERAEEYAGIIGYYAARAARSAAFVIVFMPVTAIVACPAHLFSLAMRRTS